MGRGTLLAIVGGIAIAIVGQILKLELVPVILLSAAWGLFVTVIERGNK